MAKVNISEIREKLLATGWQSWSPRKRSLLGVPAWNDPPFEDDYLPRDIGKRTVKKPAIGWCSWYTFGPNITEEKILDQTEWFSHHREIPIEYILVDDGWSKWKNVNGSLEKVAKEIKKLGLKPGIWIAPFKGKNKLTPDNLISLGFELIKLDFLYKAYYLPGISAQKAGDTIRYMLTNIKHKYPDVYTIACGCPLLPAINVVDSMRIGPDTIDPITGEIPIWGSLINSYKLRLVKNNIDRRLWTNKYWNLDPDVFVCRKSLGLTNKQIFSLQSGIRKAAGNIFLGDDAAKLDKERIRKFILPLFR